MRATKFVVAMVSILSLSFVGTPAHAETKIRQDRADDPPTKIDITRARYSYGDDQVRVVARIPQLGRAGKASDLLKLAWAGC